MQTLFSQRDWCLMVVNKRAGLVSTILLGLLSLTACAGRPEGVLAPVAETSKQASIVEMMVITTRQPSGDVDTLYNGERDTNITLNDIAVSIPPDKNRKIGDVQWPRKLPPDPGKNFATVRVQKIAGAVEAKRWMAGHLPKNRRVMVFIHGFNNTFEDSVFRFAQIVHDSKADVAPVLFTWPSRASIFDYAYDRESTNFSRDGLEEALRLLAADPNIDDVTILAHSMGTWLTVETLRQMAIRSGSVPKKIRNVILASPDIDVDVFGMQWRAMGKDKPHLTIFTSKSDRALTLSRRISGNVDRLGQIDPAAEPYRSALEKAGIVVIDLTALGTSDGLNHSKFAKSPEVVRLIGQRLVTGQTITDSDVGLGDRLGAVAMGAAQGVGSAASLVVTAPIAVFDPNTRRNYGEQVNRFGRSVGNTVGAVTEY